MKKIISLILASIMLICTFCVPVMADKVTSSVYMNAEFDLETQVVSFSGKVSANAGVKWVTYYFLYPGKTQDDIPNDSEADPVVSQYGQVKADENGDFAYEFKYAGEPGVYTLYVTSGTSTVARIIDTTQDLITVDNGPLAELHALPTSYAAPKSTTVRDVFFEKKNGEYADDMPVVEPVDVENTGTYKVFVDVENGNDETAKGTIEEPFKTIKGALAKFNPESGMVLTLRGGTYPVSDALQLKGVNASAELPFIVTNYQDEEVVIAGGTDIDSSAFVKVTDNEILQRLNPEIVSDIRVADLKAMGITEYGSITSSSSPVLFVDGNKYTIARYPNATMTGMRKAPIEIADTNNGTASAISSVVTNGVVDSGSITVAIGSNCGQRRTYSKRGTENGTTDKGAEFCVEDIRPFSWVNTGEIWMYGSFYEEWAKSTVRITELNAHTRSIRTTPVSSWGCRYNSANKFYYYNVLEELDAPGEWFMDKATGKLYIYPISDLKDQDILYSTSDKVLWSITNSSNVIINGITFKNSRGRGLNIGDENNPAYDTIVQNCKFENLGEGVYVYGSYSGVINSELKDVDGNGIYINGRPSSNTLNLIPHRLFAQNNVLYSTHGIVTAGVGNIVSHNLVSNNIGSAIYFSGSRESVAEYNEIVGGPRVTLDSGAFYVNGNQHFNRGNHIRYNYIHDIGATGPRALYFDDMLSENYAYSNVCEGWMHVHNGSENTVYNNLFIDHQAHNAININGNYYTGWNIRWQNGSLEYGSVTSSLKPGNSYNDGNGNIAPAYAARYPKLQEWATLMYKRIAEYEGKIEGGIGKGVVKGSNFPSPYIPHEKAQNFNLDQYLRAARDNHVENNVIINSKEISVGYTEKTKVDTGNFIQDLLRPTYYQKEMKEGVWRTDSRNNITKETNPFTNGDYGDVAVYESLGIEPIPFDKIGLTDSSRIPANGKSKAVSPVSGATVVKEDLQLQYTGVEGAQLYTVEVATDSAFTDIVSSKSTRDMTFDVNGNLASGKSLEDGKTYYWRIKTIAEAKGSAYNTVVSDTFEFTTFAASDVTTDGYNKFGISAYHFEDASGNVITTLPADGKFRISAYCYNLSDADKEAKVYAACYDEEGRFITMTSTDVIAVSDEFSDEVVLSINAPGTALVKLFVWSAGGEMIPYSFVKTMQ